MAEHIQFRCRDCGAVTSFELPIPRTPSCPSCRGIRMTKWPEPPKEATPTILSHEDLSHRIEELETGYDKLLVTVALNSGRILGIMSKLEAAGLYDDR